MEKWAVPDALLKATTSWGREDVLEQEVLIAKVRELAVEDERIVAVLMYGSFALSEGDHLSDIEFYLYFGAPLDGVDRRRWLERLGPIELHYVNEFGTDTVIFSNAIRGEFHFEPASSISTVAKWDNAWFPSQHTAIVLDRTGELARTLGPFAKKPPAQDRRTTAEFISRSLVNWTLMGANLLNRGEIAGALALLGRVHVDVLKAARMVEGSTVHWLSPSRHLEDDISPESYERFRTCTAALAEPDLRAAYVATWRWARELMEVLAGGHELALPQGLLSQIDERVFSPRPPPGSRVG